MKLSLRLIGVALLFDGAAHLSSVEARAGEGAILSLTGPRFVTAPISERIEFFERKVRPVLAERCYECHSAGAKKIGGGLLLDSRAGIIKGGDTGPVITPGNPEASLLVHAVRHTDLDLTMPHKELLSPLEIADLEAWVRMGVPDPRTADTVAVVKAKDTIDWEKAREWWAFRPIASPQIPEVKLDRWPANEIDRFILARLEQEGLKPVGDAEKRVLIRRATFDLIGLPPKPDEIDAFLADDSPNAFSKVVDRLLASPQYGERWGRYWLDVVRYADTAGDNSDFPIPQMYRYRNWVINAFNRDLPYDQFVREQLAGDLLPGATPEETHDRLIATGYIANSRRFGSRVDDYPQHLTIEDTIDNLGRTFLGLSISCARCHDHKFDPITSADYYALYGIFQSTRYPWPGIELEQKQRDLVPLVSAAEAEAAMKSHREMQKQFDARIRRLEADLKSAEGDAKKAIEKSLDDEKKAAELHRKTPLPFEQAYAVTEAKKIEDAAIQQKGDPAKPGAVVRRRFLTVLQGVDFPPDETGSGRLRLADAITERNNPLTARVMVNRLWLHHFGKGLVPTPNDFGKQGKPPTHPELLDWLAARFVDSCWSVKSMHRLILLSRTYQQASDPSSVISNQSRSGTTADSLITGSLMTDYFSPFPRRRLDAEAMRDTFLALGGNLDTTPGGPHPFPPQTEWKFTQHNPFKAVYDTPRRSVYLMTPRIQRHPYLAVFDGADPATSTPLRTTSTTPLQALYLLNDPLVHEQSKHFAARIVSETRDNTARLNHAYQLALGRLPETKEVDGGRKFFAAVGDKLRAAGTPADQLESESWQAFVRVLFRLNEFVYVD